MGTGITSILLHQLPYQFKGLGIISNVIFVLNVLLFVLFLGISMYVRLSAPPPADTHPISPVCSFTRSLHRVHRSPFASLLSFPSLFPLDSARYTLWPRIWNAMLSHPQQSLFLGTFPMGFATIINMVVFTCVPAWGQRWVATLGPLTVDADHGIAPSFSLGSPHSLGCSGGYAPCSPWSSASGYHSSSEYPYPHRIPSYNPALFPIQTTRTHARTHAGTDPSSLARLLPPPRARRPRSHICISLPVSRTQIHSPKTSIRSSHRRLVPARGRDRRLGR